MCSINSTVTATSEMRAEKKWCGGSEPFDHKFAGLNLNGFFIRECKRVIGVLFNGEENHLYERSQGAF